jgi:hypothetical protein
MAAPYVEDLGGLDGADVSNATSRTFRRLHPFRGPETFHADPRRVPAASVSSQDLDNVTFLDGSLLELISYA